MPSEMQSRHGRETKLTNEIIKPQQHACKLAIILEYDVDPRADTAVNQLYSAKSEYVHLVFAAEMRWSDS
jgi:hypothetical protein